VTRLSSFCDRLYPSSLTPAPAGETHGRQPCHLAGGQGLLRFLGPHEQEDLCTDPRECSSQLFPPSFDCPNATVIRVHGVRPSSSVTNRRLSAQAWGCITHREPPLLLLPACLSHWSLERHSGAGAWVARCMCSSSICHESFASRAQGWGRSRIFASRACHCLGRLQGGLEEGGQNVLSI
jgi:hypothetical protein